jgi:hypothetical protein
MLAETPEDLEIDAIEYPSMWIQQHYPLYSEKKPKEGINKKQMIKELKAELKESKQELRDINKGFSEATTGARGEGWKNRQRQIKATKTVKEDIADLTEQIKNIEKSDISDALTNYLWDNNKKLEEIDRITEYIKRNPSGKSYNKDDLREMIVSFIRDGTADKKITSAEIVKYLKAYNADAMSMTATKKSDVIKEIPKSETKVPFFVPKIHPDYENIPEKAKSSVPYHEEINNEIKRINKLKKIPAGKERATAEINSFGSLIGNASLGSPQGKWSFSEWKTREEAQEERLDAMKRLKSL